MVAIGVDIVEISRIERALARHGKTFLNRVYTVEEQRYCLAKKDPESYLAARFAAKEAVSKALGVGIGVISWQDIEVVRKDSGQPQVVLRGQAVIRLEEIGGKQVLLSMSHAREYAVAQAVITG